MTGKAEALHALHLKSKHQYKDDVITFNGGLSVSFDLLCRKSLEYTAIYRMSGELQVPIKI